MMLEIEFQRNEIVSINLFGTKLQPVTAATNLTRTKWFTGWNEEQERKKMLKKTFQRPTNHKSRPFLTKISLHQSANGFKRNQIDWSNGMKMNDKSLE